MNHLIASTIPSDLAQFGPFAGLVVLAVAIMAAASRIFYAWARNMEDWLPPSLNFPKAAPSLVLLLSGGGVALQFVFASRETFFWYVGGTIACMLGAAICFLFYSREIGRHRYHREVVTEDSAVRIEDTLGGSVLTTEAKKQLRLHAPLTVQQLFKGAAYQHDLVWTRESQERVKNHILILFMATLVLGTWGLTAAAITTKTHVLDRGATAAPPSSHAWSSIETYETA